MPLYLTEAEVAELLEPADAVEAVEACFRRLAAGEIENVPRQRTRWEEGFLAVMWAVDRELGLAGLKTYAAGRDGTHFVVLLFETETTENVAVIEADKLGQLRTGAASGVAAKHLAREGAAHARRDRLRLAGAQPGGRDPRGGADDRDRRRLLPQRGSPRGVLPRGRRRARREPSRPGLAGRGRDGHDLARPGAARRVAAARARSVCAVGANDPRRRELDNVVLERAAFVCCDSVENAKRESGDLIEPVEAGVLDWLEVQELQEVVAGELPGRQADDDIVVFKSNGLAAWDVAVGAVVLERARERGVGREL